LQKRLVGGDDLTGCESHVSPDDRVYEISLSLHANKRLQRHTVGLSLDIGAGEKGRGDINTDIRPLSGIDVVCHALNLPFRDQVFAHAFLSHIVEHFRYIDVMVLLGEVRRVLRVNGIIEIWTPNFQALGFLRAWIFGGGDNRNPPLLYAPLSGLQDYQSNVHLSHWSLKLLKAYVASQGFKITYVKGEMTYSGILMPLRLFSMLFPNRGGDIHLIAKKTVGEG